MPAKRGSIFTLNLHPAEGVTPESVARLSSWVGACSDQYLIITEPNAKGGGVHCHALIHIGKVVSDTQGIKRQLQTLFAEELKDPGNWGPPSIQVSCHLPENFYTVAGGYFDKDSGKTVITKRNIDESKLPVGKAVYEKMVANAAIKKANKNQIPRLFREYYIKLQPEISKCFNFLLSEAHTPVAEEHITAQYKIRVFELIAKTLILDGYFHLIVDINNKNFREAVLKYWTSFFHNKEHETNDNESVSPVL